MEIVLCIFLGIWISSAGALAYYWLKREASPLAKEREASEPNE